jgi:DNA-directed RNA polymerase specialized sigma24 family protein
MVTTIDKEEVIAARESLFIDLYKKAFPLVANYVSKKGGSFEEAKDIFQDALVIWYEKKQVNLQYSEASYIFGIARHLWSATMKEKIRQQSLPDPLTDLPVSTNKLLALLQTAGQKCMDLLRAFYYDKLPLDKVAGQFGFSGVRSATVQKYKCLEKVRETIKEKSLSYEDFLD